MRELVWFGAYFFWAYFKKPSQTSFLEIRTEWIGFVGLGLIAVGLVVQIWSTVVLSASIDTTAPVGKPLVESGPYRFVRNPIYLSGAAVFVGIYLIYANFQMVDIVAAIIVGLLVHLCVVRIEEPAARRHIGEPYDEYFRNVPRWIPRIPKSRKSNTNSN